MANDVTRLLQDWQSGKKDALDDLLPIVYDELRRVAHRLLSNEYAETMPTTALVHEAYLKLVNQHSVDWENRGQFFAIAAQAMRRILVDHARTRHAHKRDGIKVTLDNAETVSVAVNESLLDLDLALNELAELDETQSRIVELRYFAGLTFDETAAVMKTSTASVFREWTFARAWLYRKINGA
ncbi:MAG: sigma-70 family RNA polymerase sigma factor [Acidobacteria bacterium]|nr:sigma-70 family RNA polymerase sigma factor [Acidobacteriota bacterium]MBK8147097.1 sigma-70 family RNA polymerase sigma factor [Acidobacteriota bacterium]MBK8812347.1 sigma-70 family RNA polymerase sigma factor [Acidobacteriota bacterium]